MVRALNAPTPETPRQPHGWVVPKPANDVGPTLVELSARAPERRMPRWAVAAFIVALIITVAWAGVLGWLILKGATRALVWLGLLAVS